MTVIHIKDAPSLNTQCLINALDRLDCLDHYFSQSREYLIKHIRNINELHMPDSLPIFLNMGLCGQITSRLYQSGFNESEVDTFMAYICWRFFGNTNYPIHCELSDFSSEVQQDMAKCRSLLSKLTNQHHDNIPGSFTYYWHQVYQCTEHFPLMQYDPLSPYGAKRLKLLKEMVRTLTEIRSYAVKIQTETEFKWPVLGSVIAPNELIK